MSKKSDSVRLDFIFKNNLVVMEEVDSDGLKKYHVHRLWPGYGEVLLSAEIFDSSRHVVDYLIDHWEPENV